MNRAKAVGIMLTALLLLLIASVAIASYSPELSIDDQPVVDGQIMIAKATVDGPGWVAIYTDDDGEPGEVIGYAPLMTGINANIPVEIDEGLATETLHAVLHEDLGFAGTFEYPGDDVPVEGDGELVSVTFQLTEADEEMATEEMDDEAMAEPTPVLDEITNQVAAFAQTFLTLRQPEEADEATAEEEVAAEDEEAVEEEESDSEASDEAASDETEAEEAATEEETAEEEIAEEETAEEEIAEKETAEEETAEADASEESDTSAEEEATDDDSSMAEEASGSDTMVQQVGAFVQSFLTLNQEESAEETAVEEEAAEEEVAEEEAVEKEAVEEPMDIVDTAIAAGSFSTLVSVLEAADLVDALKGEGPFTVFAPTDDAFAAVPEALLAELQANPELLVQTLLYHVVPDKLMADDIALMGSALTLEGDMLPFAVDGDAVMVGDANVAAADVEAANGVIHVIDQVLLPPALAEAVAAVAEPVVEEEPEPEAVQSISASYQETDGSTVMVDSVVSAGDGWVSIRTDESFTPGEILGYTDVPAGESTVLVIELDMPLTEDTMVWAALHVDDGEAGVFEYPDADDVATYSRAAVMGPFNVVVAVEDEMEETAATEDADEEDAAPEEADDAEADDASSPAEGVDLSGMAEVAGAAMHNLLGALQPGDEMAEDDDDGEMAADDDAMAEDDDDGEMADDDDAMAEDDDDGEMADDDDAMAEDDDDGEMADDDDAMAEDDDDGEMADDDDAMAEKDDDGEMADDDDAMAEKDDDGEMADDDDAMAEKDDDSEMAAAPDALPETGLNLATGGATVPVVVLVLGLLVVGAFVTRRRPE